ncbi:MAG: hypothetical protein E7565_03525 [Ruminococcaceae bacterium]|nr:hypothetical protein [Oscillospiraceae bacterium]
MIELSEERLKFENSKINKLNHKVRLLFHPLLWIVITLRNILSGYKVIHLNKMNIKTKRPIIFCITHIGKADIEISAQILKKHFYLLSGDFENVHGNLDGFFLELHGIIYLDKFNKNDTKSAKEKAVKTLNKNGNIMWFVEGTWNLSENLPVLPLPFGVIEVAQKTGALILPVALEQYDKKVYVNFGELFDVSNYEKTEDEYSFKISLIQKLRDQMATLKFQIWEKQEPFQRENIPSNYHQKYVDYQVSQWKFTYEEIESKVFNPPNIIKYQKAFEHLNEINPTKQNAFLFNKRLKG